MKNIRISAKKYETLNDPMLKKNLSAQDPCMQELITTRKRLSHTKYVLLAAFIFGLMGLFWSPKVGLIIFAVLIGLWGVGTYIAFMHYLSAKKILNKYFH